MTGHDLVIYALARLSTTELSVDIASLLYNLKDLRTRADYDLEDDDISVQVPRALRLGNAIVDWADDSIGRST